MSDYIPLNLKDYKVSEKVGFLLEDPLDSLPAYFAPWETLAKNLEIHLEKREVRKLVDEMPLLDQYHSEMLPESDRHKQLCLAYVFLTFIGSAYIYNEGEGELAKVIPRQLAIPWHGISQKLGLKPVPCMSSVALNNYRVKDKQMPISLENLDLICSVPGGRWFFLVTIQVEVEAVKGIKAILKAKQAVHARDDNTLKLSLHEMTESIQQITKTSSRMSEGLKPEIFYNEVRPYLAGYGGKSKIPEGLIFEGVSETAMQAIGGSAAQSSTMQSFDAALGIKHDSERQEYLDKVREYMPPDHREFIKALWQEPSIKNYVTSSQDTELKDLYNAAVDALCKFRALHQGLVQSFILKPAEATFPNNANEERGTGGTAIVEFLTSIERTTKEAKEKIDPMKIEE